MDDLQAELAALRARVEALEQGQSTVRAPFRVVDEEGRTLLSVEVDDDSGRGRTVRLKLTAVPDGEALTFRASEIGNAELLLGETVQLSSYGYLNMSNADGSSRAHLSALDEESLLTLRCSPFEEMPQVQLGATESHSNLILAQLSKEAGRRRGSGIVLNADQQRPTYLQISGPEGAIEMSVAVDEGGRIVLRDGDFEEICRFP